MAQYCLFSHLWLDCERFGESFASMKMLPASHPLVKYLVKKDVNKIDVGRAHSNPLLSNCPKECSILYPKILQYLWNNVDQYAHINDIIGKPIKITHIVECKTFFMDVEEWSEDELEDAIAGEDVDELRHIVECLEAEDPHLEVDDYHLRKLGLTKADLDNPHALLEVYDPGSE